MLALARIHKSKGRIAWGLANLVDPNFLPFGVYVSEYILC